MASERRTRPFSLRGRTTRVVTGCGNLYVTVNNNDRPLEVFARLGKSGGCIYSWAEALTRIITLALKYSISVDEIAEELSQIRCPNSVIWPEDKRVLSCADGIAKVLAGGAITDPKEY